MSHSITLIQMVDAISFAPARVGTLVRVDLDVTEHRTLWYQKQYRDEKRDYVVWRKITAPPEDGDYFSSDEDDPVALMIGEPSRGERKPIHWVESRGDIERKIEYIKRARPSINVLRVWEDER
jgi:hypothetical protein